MRGMNGEEITLENMYKEVLDLKKQQLDLDIVLDAMSKTTTTISNGNYITNVKLSSKEDCALLKCLVNYTCLLKQREIDLQYVYSKLTSND